MVAMAAGAAAGSWGAAAAPGWVGATPCLVAGALLLWVGLRVGRHVLAVAATAALVLCLGVRAWAGLDQPRPGTPWSGGATLVTDPVRRNAGYQAELRIGGGRRVEAWAFGRSAQCMTRALAGERVVGAGTLGPVPRAARRRLAVRHVAGRLSLTACRPGARGAPWWRGANALRRTLVEGARPLGEERRSLWAGLVIGDDREEDPGVVSDFSAAGLTHLLAVSGQNVAFALAAVGPLLRRLGRRPRGVASLAVLAGFAVVVRFDPSVLRASVMAALAVVATARGVGAPTVRLVCLAVVALLAVDPLLVHRLGFQLSVAATAGIAVLSRPIAARLRGPVWLRQAAATTLAAQIATAPLLATLGGTSPAAVPANVLAVPAAGPVMIWGLSGGLLAGLVGGPVRTVVHLPTRVLLWWLVTVARTAAAAPFAPIGMRSLAVALGLGAIAGACRIPRLRRGLAAAALAVLVVPSLVAGVGRGEATDRPSAARGVAVWRSRGTIVAVVGDGDPARVLGHLRSEGVGSIDLLVVDGRGRGVLAVAAAVLQRHDVRALAGVPGVDIEGLRPLGRDALVAGPFTVTTDARRHPVVRAAPAGAVTGGR